jgi:hypothetical protein
MTHPIITSTADLTAAVGFAQDNPEARWYVVKRAQALGADRRIPAAWLSAGALYAVTAAAGAMEDGSGGYDALRTAVTAACAVPDVALRSDVRGTLQDAFRRRAITLDQFEELAGL